MQLRSERQVCKPGIFILFIYTELSKCSHGLISAPCELINWNKLIVAFGKELSNVASELKKKKCKNYDLFFREYFGDFK